MEKQLFDDLLKVNKFDVPEAMVQRQLQGLVNDAKMRLMYQGYKKEDIDSQEEKLKETLIANATKQVKTFFVLEEIAKKENIEVKENELDQRIEVLAKTANQDLSTYRKTLEEKDLIDSVRKQLLHDKVINFLFDNAKIS